MSYLVTDPRGVVHFVHSDRRAPYGAVTSEVKLAPCACGLNTLWDGYFVLGTVTEDWDQHAELDWHSACESAYLKAIEASIPEERHLQILTVDPSGNTTAGRMQVVFAREAWNAEWIGKRVVLVSIKGGVGTVYRVIKEWETTSDDEHAYLEVARGQ